MKNVIINNGRATVTVTAAHNVTVTEKAITIDLVTGFNLTKKTKTKTTTKAKTNKVTKTAKRRGRPAKATSQVDLDQTTKLDRGQRNLSPIFNLKLFIMPEQDVIMWPFEVPKHIDIRSA